MRINDRLTGQIFPYKLNTRIRGSRFYGQPHFLSRVEANSRATHIISQGSLSKIHYSLLLLMVWTHKYFVKWVANNMPKTI